MKIFTLRIPLLLTLLLIATLGLGQDVYQTVGIIGTATPKGWDDSTPMKLATSSDVHQWTITFRCQLPAITLLVLMM
jgi:hypothetical protein